jgi:dipeptidyl-peptidase-3
MIEKYIEHFESGDIDAHKDSQRAWVKDLSPVVETNIGWVETYIDPENSRAFWEGWVCISDKDKSAKF